MISLEHVLFPTDFSPCAENALAEAVSVAHRYGATLTLLHVVVPHAEEGDDPLDRFPTEQAVEALEPEGGKGLAKVDRAVVRGFSAADKILSFAKANHVGLIVMGSHGRRGFSRAILGSEAERVLRLAPCPVLSVSEKVERGLAKAPKRILVPIDFSSTSDEALANAVQIGKEYHATVDVVHVFDEPVVPPFLMDHTGSYISTDPKMKDRCLESMDKHLERIAGGAGNVEKYVLEGRIVPTLRKFAEEKQSDLIVIGTRGLSGLDYVLLGSTASHLLRVATCPVLTVHGEAAGEIAPDATQATAKAS